MWVKPWLKRRINLGFYEKLVQELRFADKSECKKIRRVTPQNFDEIMRDSIPANINRNNTVFG